jgi:His-Xaa-Ser system radical SAM maturase HxsC
MLKLGGKVVQIKVDHGSSNLIISVTTNEKLPLVMRSSKAYLVKKSDIPLGFKHYLFFDQSKKFISELSENKNYTILSDEFGYLDDNDIIRLAADGNAIRVLFRASSPHNTILLTEQCNHYCLMCSQPPKDIDDSWILDDVEKLIRLIPRNTAGIGFTGGEPTLDKKRFLKILELTKNFLPNTSIHVLSNGRSFIDFKFTQEYALLDHHDIMIGVPIYSDDPALHDYIVQAEGAFDETIRGILNLKKLNQKVEIRIVLHKLTIPRLIKLCEFIVRNLLFVDHVALMGLEMMGFTRANIDKLWIDPYEYKDELSKAVKILTNYGITTSVYNHQLCLVNSDIKPYYVKSISDWKNEFAPECVNCSKANECGGFFSSGIKYKYSAYLKPFKNENSDINSFNEEGLGNV